MRTLASTEPRTLGYELVHGPNSTLRSRLHFCICDQQNVPTWTLLQVLKGHGIERHLLGLKLQAIEEGLSVPKIFMDTAYGLATHWKLRTGQVRAFLSKYF